MFPYWFLGAVRVLVKFSRGLWVLILLSRTIRSTQCDWLISPRSLNSPPEMTLLLLLLVTHTYSTHADDGGGGGLYRVVLSIICLRVAACYLNPRTCMIFRLCALRPQSIHLIALAGVFFDTFYIFSSPLFFWCCFWLTTPPPFCFYFKFSFLVFVYLSTWHHFVVLPGWLAFSLPLLKECRQRLCVVIRSTQWRPNRAFERHFTAVLNSDFSPCTEQNASFE